LNNFSLENLQSLTPIEFENLVKTLLQQMGFNAATTKASGDGGIDIIALSEQPIVSGKYVIQCKRYAIGNNIGEPVIRELYGVMMHENANKGILVTTSDFTKAAMTFAQDKTVELINGNQLLHLLNKYLANFDDVDHVTFHGGDDKFLKRFQQFQQNIDFLLRKEELRIQHNNSKKIFSDAAEYYHRISTHVSDYTMKQFGIRTPTVGAKLDSIKGFIASSFNYYSFPIRQALISEEEWVAAKENQDLRLLGSFLEEYINKTLEVYREFDELTPPNNESAISYYDSCISQVKKIFVILKATDELMRSYNPLLVKLVFDNLNSYFENEE